MSRALTGIRPTGELTFANVVSAVHPLAAMQETYDGPINAFVADIHGLTDQEPAVVNRSLLGVVRTYIAGGVDPDRTTFYLQSQVEPQTLKLQFLLGRHLSMNELLRMPSLKEKVGEGEEGTASVALGLYPVLMAADILLQDANDVPVGEDNRAHLELARKVARRFNHQYGSGETILVEPELLASDALRIMALKGGGKMSKSYEPGALGLSDRPDDIARKIAGAETAAPGMTSDALESHFLLASLLNTNPDRQRALDKLYEAHMNGGRVMKEFKQLFTEIAVEFLGEFQQRVDSISDEDVKAVLRAGGTKTRRQANRVINRVKEAMNLRDADDLLRAGS